MNDIEEKMTLDQNKADLLNLWQFIGNTKLIEIRYRYERGPLQRILAKCEYGSLTGSIKDRMALYILEKAYEMGQIMPGDQIVEATSGNTGIAFAAIGTKLGHPVKIIIPDWMSKERMSLLRAYGADVQLVSKEEGGFLGSIKIAEAMSYDDKVFLPRQFQNKYNIEAHEKTTGREIDLHLLHLKIKPHAFVAGVGTGGTIMGVGGYLKSIYPDIKIHPLEPAESPTLSTGFKVGSHRIQGIGDEFIPSIVDLSKLDEVVQVCDGDAIIMAQRLCRELGLGVGISSGANLLGAIKIQSKLGCDSNVVTVFPDSNQKYLSTALFQEEPIKANYFGSKVTLEGYKVYDNFFNY
ncbi:PLP-dependent cysteine synthase family protein [Mucilaginibacter corticis]|uniref:cysteine synthase n=1 Tax=Mucilaginibacter corticis TaxID=2597670 RepID=A0A556MXD6_9SPHI|nr:PLP-dependent cysteine synthase family protein [Mucilaginibacter corticis]TSJ44483.1 PLP-dependent cysteine synthase family protein [Mucilaginibacter corticis]